MRYELKFDLAHVLVFVVLSDSLLDGFFNGIKIKVVNKDISKLEPWHVLILKAVNQFFELFGVFDKLLYDVSTLVCGDELEVL